ncbi:hypothetical protein BDV39DRAFT_167418 [Aspergillus sergii]|uniref:Uncharacterized protein n=1 Tax=Aspergillus sergii TaxID=1034303 RepID=A0A5N6XGX4_9EURO|nr:hypothetical protein BDV39DRAFT_167418 [Aspergillus sergii]
MLMGSFTRLMVGISYIGSRFISTFRRDNIGDVTREDKEFLSRGDMVAHDGKFLAYAKPYSRDMGKSTKRQWNPKLPATHRRR